MQEDKDALGNFQSEDLLEKLKILNYEQNLLQEFKMKPISRYYFVKSVNPGEQFYMFTLICWWLCTKLGKNMQRPQEYDDPHVVTEKITKVLEEMDVPVDFSPSKLIRGAGASCIFVLDSLATQVLKVAKISFQRAIVTQEDETATEYLEDNAEIILERLEDEQNAALSDDSDIELEAGTFKQLNWAGRLPNKQDALMATGGDEDAAKDLVVYQQQWQEECERVLPLLKVYVKADARDWRSHLSQIEALKSNIENYFDETQTQLKKLHNEMTFNLEKVESREKHMNNELQTLLQEHKQVSIELSNVLQAQEQQNAEMERMKAELQQIVQENEVKKAEMEKRGQAMSDGSSVLQIKKATTKLKEDLSQLNLEVALLVNSLDQHTLRQTDSEVLNLNVNLN